MERPSRAATDHRTWPGSPCSDRTSYRVIESSGGLPKKRSQTGDSFRIVLHGEVDLVRNTELLVLVADFRRSGAVDVRVDLEQVDFMDSAGLMALGHLREIAVRRGGTVCLVRPNRPVRRILDVSGFGALCDIVD